MPIGHNAREPRADPKHAPAPDGRIPGKRLRKQIYSGKAPLDKLTEVSTSRLPFRN